MLAAASLLVYVFATWRQNIQVFIVVNCYMDDFGTIFAKIFMNEIESDRSGIQWPQRDDPELIDRWNSEMAHNFSPWLKLVITKIGHY